MRSRIVAYGVAVVALAAAVLLRWLLEPLLAGTLPLVTLFAAVAAASWAGGNRPALAVTVLGYVACAYLFIQPHGGFTLNGARNFVGLVAYLVTCFIIIGFGDAVREYRRRLTSGQEPSFGSAPTDAEAALRKHSVRDIAVIGFGLTLAVLVAGALLGYANTVRLIQNSRKVTRTHEVIENLEALLSTIKDAETGQRGYLLTEDAKYLHPYETAVGRIDSEIARLKELTSEDRDYQAHISTLEQKVALKLAELKRTLDMAKAGDRAAALAIVRENVGQALMDGVRSDVSALQNAEHDLLQARADETEASKETTLLSIILSGAIGVALVGIVFRLSRRNAIQRQRAAATLAEQRERLRVTLSSIGDAVITTNVEGDIVSLNPVAESLTGWTQAEAVGKPLNTVFRIVNEQTRREVENPAKRSLREGVVVGLANHTLLIRKDGAEQPIDDSAAPIRDGQGRVVGCVLVFRDVSVRRRMERQIAERLAAARMLASIVESSEDAIVGKSLEGVIRTWNKAAERLFGYTPAEAVGRHISLIIPADRIAEEDQILARIRAGENMRHFDTVRLRKGGEPVDVSLTISPIRDEEGRVVGASKIARDITEAKKAEKRIYDLMAELKAGDQHKNEFLATLAHELRGPLAPLRNTLEIMKREDARGETFEDARNRMERQVAHLVRLVDDLIDVNRINRNTIELRQEPVELAAIIQQSVEACRPLADCGNLEMSVSLPPEPIWLRADLVRLVQVFSNLLNNACKYTDPGGRIWLVVQRQGSDAVVKVGDTGIGIPSDKLDSVFEMFTQVDRTLERSKGGLGIGLTLAKRLVEMHGGTISVQSEGPGRGSEFQVRLPVLVERPPADAPRPAAHAADRPRRMLVVDDNADAGESLAMLLKLGGNETRLAHDGLEAVEAAEKFRPDVILLDIGLPKLNGFDACRSIREKDWGQKMVIVALTGWGQDDDRRKSKEAGFNGHLVKPVDHAVLMRLLAEIDHQTAPLAPATPNG